MWEIQLYTTKTLFSIFSCMWIFWKWSIKLIILEDISDRGLINIKIKFRKYQKLSELSTSIEIIEIIVNCQNYGPFLRVNSQNYGPFFRCMILSLNNHCFFSFFFVFYSFWYDFCFLRWQPEVWASFRKKNDFDQHLRKLEAFLWAVIFT